MGKHTPFYDLHVKANGKMVDFAGWEMPLHYGSQLDEHHNVRQHAGVFDVSHMGVVDLQGEDVENFLRHLLANDVKKLTSGRALYTCMLNENGGVIDDLIVYKLDSDFYRVVINAGRRDVDVNWIKQHAAKWNTLVIERNDLSMLAIQGPEVKDKLPLFLAANEVEAVKNLKLFSFAIFNDLFIARTGYTGEDGFEIIFGSRDAKKWWSKIVSSEIRPCGLGARDTLRLEAGLNLYGSDMDETVTPLESNLTWTVVFDDTRDFIGKAALEKQKSAGVPRRLVGLVLEGPGIMRNHQKVIVDGETGEITSGGYSPTLEMSIGFARIPNKDIDTCFVEIRGKQVKAKIVKLPFVRMGKKLVSLS